MKKIDFNFFPGWTRKAISFTIDDGCLDMDKKFLDIVRPCGIKGTFNISSNNVTRHNKPDMIRLVYSGYEISNHVKLHPAAFWDGEPVKLSNDFFDEAMADKEVCYRAKETPEGTYLRFKKDLTQWQYFCTAEGYIALVDQGKTELEEIFGENTVRGFVWPFCRWNNKKIIEYLTSHYYGLRGGGKSSDEEYDNFFLPYDRTDWKYNARHSDLIERAAQFEASSNDEKLKWFCFGVHSYDFERDGKWDDLRVFAQKYGNRPNDFWYATNIEVFDYEDAIKKLVIENGIVKNYSNVELYIKIDNKKITIPPMSQLNIGCT